MPEIDVDFTTVPNQAAIDFLKQKLNITTNAWDDTLKEVHAKAFVVAGATKLALLKDLREAVAHAVEDGESIGQFRKRFDALVQQHGWDYKGQRGWRTRVIYDNNMRSAAMAGQWDRIQQNKVSRPYLMYRTAGDSRVRKQHKDWDRVVLPVDDEFWDSHYPANGYGCRCDVRTLSEREMTQKGLSVSDRPEIKTTHRTNKITGEDYGDVPDGIDTGWDYNVGKAWMGGEKALGDQLVNAPKRIQEQFDLHSTVIQERLESNFKQWAEKVVAKDDGKAKGESKGKDSESKDSKNNDSFRDVAVIGYLKSGVIRFLRAKGVKVNTSAVAAGRSVISGSTLFDIDMPKLPARFNHPDALKWDPKIGRLVMVLGDNETDDDKSVVSELVFSANGVITMGAAEVVDSTILYSIS